jgi:hypothetical protein
MTGIEPEENLPRVLIFQGKLILWGIFGEIIKAVH